VLKEYAQLKFPLFFFSSSISYYSSNMEQGLGFLGNMFIASPLGFSTPPPPLPFLNKDVRVVGEALPLISSEWTQGTTKCLLELVKEKIDTNGFSLFQQKYLMRIREQLVRNHLSKEKKTWLQVKDK
jgi:hypothetical protein